MKTMMDENNVLAQTFRMISDKINENESCNLSLRLLRNRTRDPRTYNLPTPNEVAVVIVGDFDKSEVGRDIIVQKQYGQLNGIHETHTTFIPLQCPLLFPRRED